MLQDISVVSPQLNIENFTASKKESSATGEFFNIFRQEVSEKTPVLNIQEFKLSLIEPVVESQQEDALLGIKNFLNSAGLKIMSLSDEVKDSKWISEKVSEKETDILDDSSSNLELTQEESEVLLSLLSSLFGNRTDTILQNQSANQISNSDTTSDTTSIETAIPNLSKLSQLVASFQINSENSSLQSDSESSLFKGASVQSSISSLLNELTLQLESANLEGDADSSKVIQGLVEKIKLSMSEGKDYTIINLKPSELGKIFVTYDADGVEKNLQIVTNNDAVKSMIEDNLGKLQEALQTNGIEVKELNLEKINFSKSKMEFAGETNTLMEKISTGDFSFSDDGEMLTDDMKDFINLFVKAKTTNKNFDNSVQDFSSAIVAKLTNSLKTETSDTGETLLTQKMIDTVVKKISQSVSEGKSEIEIKLVPESLGKLTVKIVSEEGKLSANIEVKNLEVKQAVEAGIVKLKEDLGQNGIHVEQINVSLSDDHYSRSRQERFLNQGEQQNITPENSESIDIEEPELIRRLGYNTLEYIV